MTGGVELEFEKSAPKLRAEFIVTEQLPVPEQAPDHPLKIYPELGVAVSVTDVPELNDALQVLPQLMPIGLLVIAPLPELLTVKL